ncbi:1-phosphofructokinase family hexose kinase [Natronospora cellulosivora (SeqCode)]
MITTVTLNPAIDREYFVKEHVPKEHKYLYGDGDIKVYPGGKGLLTAINLKQLGHPDVQNIGFVGGKQGLFFEKMVQDYKVTSNYIYTSNEIRNNVFIIAKDPVTYTHYNDYTYKVSKRDVEDLMKRFKRAIVDSEIVIIAGSVPEGVDFDIYLRMINICNEKNKEVYLQASGEVLNLALKAKPKVVTPYFKHTRQILDREVVDFEDYTSVCKNLIEEGAQHVTVPYHCSRLLCTDGKVFSLDPIDFCLTNWLGTGDAYNAGYCDYVIRNGFNFLEANKYGAAAALAVAEEKSIFIKDREQVEKNLHRIVVKELEV